MHINSLQGKKKNPKKMKFLLIDFKFDFQKKQNRKNGNLYSFIVNYYERIAKFTIGHIPKTH